jgi:L-aspartate oxidase
VDLDGDFLIIGSGIAALRAAAALGLAGKVIVLTKAEPAEGSTGYAQGGIAAAVGDNDSPELHARDTIEAGDGLCDEGAVRILVEDGALYVRELIEWGARFDRDASGRLSLAREGAHSVPRVLHARDATGREIGRTLWERVSAVRAVRVIPHALAIEIIRDGERAVGARFLGADGTPGVARASALLIATGGVGQIYRETTNPAVACGDGITMAYRAGATVADLEFVQFHPTALAVDGAPRFLLSEALRGEGGRLVNADGEPFMAQLEPLGDLAPRDRVARGISREAARTGQPIYLSRATAFLSARPLITSWVASGRTWTVERRFPGCSPRARRRAPAFTARTALRATRCWKGSSSARAQVWPCVAGSTAPVTTGRRRRSPSRVLNHAAVRRRTGIRS